MMLKMERNSFNALRLFAAFLVFHTHHYALNGLNEPRVPWFDTSYSGLGVGAFFAISGYLVTKSAYRDPLIWSFLWKRALRIMPGLTVNVLFTVALGAAFTTLTLADYFSSDVTQTFMFRNILIPFNDPRYVLPGVFETNPAFGVNGSLWTLPYEISLYFVIGMLFFCARSDVMRTMIATLFLGASFVLMLIEHYYPGANLTFFTWNWLTSRQFGIAGLLFFYGALVALASKTRSLLSIAHATGAVCVFLAWGDASLVAAYLALGAFAISFGESKIARLPARLGDISYGFYLYAFPIQQASVSLIGTGHPRISYAVALICSVLLAIASWWLIERPFLQLKGAGMSSALSYLARKILRPLAPGWRHRPDAGSYGSGYSRTASTGSETQQRPH